MIPLFAYNVAYHAALLAASPLLPFFMALNTYGLREGLADRLGNIPVRSGDPALWFHASSLGEVSAVRELISRVHQSAAAGSFLLTVMTPAGWQTAHKALADRIYVKYLPFDSPLFLRRAFRRFEPDLLVLVEAEIWPNLIAEARRAGTKVMLVNGRISRKSAERFRLFKRSFRELMSAVSLFCMRSDEDARILKSLLGNDGRIITTGNMKHDGIIARIDPEVPAVLRRRLGMREGRRVFVAGSIREGEEVKVVTACVRARASVRDLIMIVAPRHLGRVSRMERELAAAGISSTRLSYITDKGARAEGWKSDALVVDTVGELFDLYSIADVAFCGGSLLPFGGHNLFEPAAWGKPVLFGPHVSNFRQEADELLRCGGGMVVRDEADLAEKLVSLLNDPARISSMGDSAAVAVKRHAGAVERSLTCINRVLAGR